MRRLISCFCILSLLTSCAYVARLPFAERDAEKSTATSYRGVLHIHSEFSHDSVASIKSLKRHARAAGLDFLILTDHNNVDALDSPDIHGSDPVMIVGQEISTPAGHMLAVGPETAIDRHQDPDAIAASVHAAEGTAILAHPFCEKSPWRDPDFQGFDGLEIYNFAHDFYPANKLKLVFQFLFLPPSIFLKTFQRIPQTALEKWDRMLLERPVFAYGGADAHIHFTLLGLPLESNRLALEAVTTNIQSDAPDRSALLDAFKKGRTFISFDYLGRAQNFDFYAQNTDGRRFSMGETVTLAAGQTAELNVYAPEKARVRLIHNGALLKEFTSVQGAVLDVQNPGYYRVEVYRKGKLWVVSNPLFVRYA